MIGDIFFWALALLAAPLPLSVLSTSVPPPVFFASLLVFWEWSADFYVQWGFSGQPSRSGFFFRSFFHLAFSRCFLRNAMFTSLENLLDINITRPFGVSAYLSRPGFPDVLVEWRSAIVSSESI